MSNVAIVGAGKVGTVLGRILSERGENVVCVVSRSLRSAKQAGKFIGCRNCSDTLDSIPNLTDFIIIATPHDAVATVALALSRLEHFPFKRLSVCHTSGMLTAAALDTVKARGAAVFSFHPLQTFPRDFHPRDIVPTSKGIYYAIDGSPHALKKARTLARKLGGKTIEIKPEMREFYHAACVVASNHLTAILGILQSMSGALGIAQKDFLRVFKPIILATLRNVERSSATAALTGPVARGGVDTVAGHFDALKTYAPELLSYFGTLTLETIKLAEAKKSITGKQALSLRQLVRSYTTST